MSGHRHVTPQRRQAWWIWLCLVSVLGFQSLGLVHRALHGHGGHLSQRIVAAASACSPDAAAVGRVDGTKDSLASAFGHSAGSVDCQLLDQLSDALGPTVQAASWTAFLPDLPRALPQPLDARLTPPWRLPARAPPLA